MRDEWGHIVWRKSDFESPHKFQHEQNHIVAGGDQHRSSVQTDVAGTACQQDHLQVPVNGLSDSSRAYDKHHNS